MDTPSQILTADDLAGEVSRYFPWGLHLADETWRDYGLAEILERIRRADQGSAAQAPREFADRVNKDSERQGAGREPVRSGHLLTAGLVLDILRYLIRVYCDEQQPGVTARASDWLAIHHTEEGLQRTVAAFVHYFPPEDVALGLETEDSFLRGADKKLANKDIALWEMALLALATQNPAMSPFNDLFDDYALRHKTNYGKIVSGLETYFASQPALDVLDMPLFEALRAPMRHSPDSLEGQLDYILERWARALPKSFLARMHVARGILVEEATERGLGPGPAVPLEFRRGKSALEDYPEPERFTIDRDWMSNVVLLAKSTYVWLDQLSKTYHREVRRLDQVPEEELDKLAGWGFNCLWLIGVWERSPASRWIKQRMGNPDALSSAYSLYDYVIAADLGGPEAYDVLKQRAAQRGIRLASDMVPNHVGLYSKWITEHPDWFVQLSYPPYPSYTFNGPNLSGDDAVTIQIEDGYWDQRDAAVVFKRTDNRSGDTRYIYHGNDGTSMPWNDTAQLNYLNPEVREAVIQTILHVARMFPVIRFDAAMTLAKRHYQRLWFPKPGDGGAVPSRAEYGMSREEFDAAMPEEFWREVVDRIQAEAPDTLLLAEAFWLMEGYFVRTLGMHRVYNSAFMNMLKMEDNQKYRLTIKNVLEFSPEVMKRFVNFMSNPDERTAVEQFGKGDKYIGCAMLMVTLPGLPMFGHGQVEGYTEKYGMEYGRAYWDEKADEDLIRRHEKEIFPLMSRRHLFSGVDQFAMFDYRSPDGWVDENVFVYTNRSVNGERSFILYNNAYNSTRGWVHTALPVNRGSADEPHYAYPTLSEALELRADDHHYYLFRDHADGLEYIRNARQLATEGLYTELHGYQYHVFLDWREAYDEDGTWGALAHRLAGRGVPNLEAARKQMLLSPLLESFRRVFNPQQLSALINSRQEKESEAWDMFSAELNSFLQEIQLYTTVAFDPDAICETLREELDLLWDFGDHLESFKLSNEGYALLASWYPGLIEECEAPEPQEAGDEESEIAAEADADTLADVDDGKAGKAAEPSDEAVACCKAAPWALPAGWLVLRNLAEAFVGADHATENARWLDDWLLTPAVGETMGAFRTTAAEGYLAAELIMAAMEHGPLIASPRKYAPAAIFDELLADEAVRELLRVNRYKDVLYLSQEQLESLLGWLLLVGAYDLTNDATMPEAKLAAATQARCGAVLAITKAAADSGYQVDAMRELLEENESSTPAGQ